MQVRYAEQLLNSFATAPPHIQRAFTKQVRLLEHNLRHPSLHAKKYNEPAGIWQARVNSDWRFYFTIQGDAYYIHDMMPHPK